MFESIAHMVREDMRRPDGLWTWVVAVGIPFSVWLIFMLIREFWCWYFKTSAITEHLKTVARRVESAEECIGRFRADFESAFVTLNRIAERVAAPAGSHPHDPGGK